MRPGDEADGLSDQHGPWRWWTKRRWPTRSRMPDRRAGIDAFREQPPVGSPLSLESIVPTPHPGNDEIAEATRCKRCIDRFRDRRRKDYWVC
jgi:hypothetical protein